MESVTASDTIRIASNLSVVIPLVIYLTKIKYASKRVHIIGALIFVSGICDLIGWIFFKNGQSTAMLFNAYYAMTFFLLSWFYYEVLFIKSRRVVVFLGLAVYLQSFVLISIFVQGITEYQTLMWIITGIIMIVYSIAYFIYSLSIIPNTSTLYYTPIWINSGVLIYFILNLFLFILSNYVLTKLDPQMSLLIWSFHNVNNVLKNILFGIGIYFYKKKVAEF
jgi:hypothetical protein